jgi:hypothetical protein
MMTQGAMVFQVAICGRIEPSGHTKIFDTIRLKFPDEYRKALDGIRTHYGAHTLTVDAGTVTLEGPVVNDSRTVASNDKGFFEFKDLEPGTAYHVTITAPGFANGTPAEIAETRPKRNREGQQAPSCDGADYRDCRLFPKRGRNRAGQDRGAAAHLRIHLTAVGAFFAPC